MTESAMRYRRIVIKLSGGAMAGSASWGFDGDSLNHMAEEVLRVHREGVQVALVVGGGNIFRGKLGEAWGIERAEADNIGMIATVINSLMVRGVLQARGAADVRVMTAIPINAVAEPFIRLRALRHLEHHLIVILAGGTGNPYVTTDYAAVQRALEVRADALLAAKDGTDGLYTGDPRKDERARRYRTASYDTVIRHNLQALDQTAVILARDHRLPIHLFDFDAPAAVHRICAGEDVGTLLGAERDVLAE
jgi:uridylate kinase